LALDVALMGSQRPSVSSGAPHTPAERGAGHREALAGPASIRTSSVGLGGSRRLFSGNLTGRPTASYSDARMTYQFGSFEFDYQSMELRMNGRLVAIEPQTARALDFWLTTFSTARRCASVYLV